jgi:hypothetical protein
VPLDGGTPVTLASKQWGVHDDIAVSATNVYWIQTSQADGGGGDAIVTMPIGGGAITEVTRANGPLSTDGASLYYFADQYRIVRMPVGGGPRTVVASNVQPRAIAVRAPGVYWANQLPYDGSIMTVVAPSCGAGQCACPSGQTLCFGACVDLETDGTNCGACGTVCGAGPLCMNGHCGV